MLHQILWKLVKYLIVWSREGFAELGESLHSLLTGLEQLGVEALPPELELEMRRAMSMSPSLQASKHTLTAILQDGGEGAFMVLIVLFMFYVFEIL